MPTSGPCCWHVTHSHVCHTSVKHICRVRDLRIKWMSHDTHINWYITHSLVSRTGIYSWVTNSTYVFHTGNSYDKTRTLLLLRHVLICVSWLIHFIIESRTLHMCFTLATPMTRSGPCCCYVWRDVLLRVSWLIHFILESRTLHMSIRHVTRINIRALPLIRVTWRIDMCVMTHSHVCRDSPGCSRWPIPSLHLAPAVDMWDLQTSRVEFEYMSHGTHRVVSNLNTWVMCVMTHQVCHDSMCAIDLCTFICNHTLDVSTSMCNHLYFKTNRPLRIHK